MTAGYVGGSIQGYNTGINQSQPDGPTFIAYGNFGSGGLNTRLDPHALDRTELAISINAWSSYDGAVAKRPGTTPLPGTVGCPGGNCLSMGAARFNGNTFAIGLFADQNLYARNCDASDSWHLLGAANANATMITVAQMFDPSQGKDVAFICDGFNIPKMWIGPSSYSLTGVATGAGHLPSQFNNVGTPITPQYVATLGNNSHLFYSGEPTNKSAVYVSDPDFPQNFDSFSMQVTVDPGVGAFQPAIIGNNDGVEGGSITGIKSLASTMIVFKEVAVYAMVQTTLLGEVPAWQVVQVANSVGCLAPLSIVGYETFICFLATDGVYITDGNTVQQISGDVPTIFDNSVTGFQADITNRDIAIAVRCGMRYMLWYSVNDNPYVSEGIWFDFTKNSRFGNPMCGQIQGMTPGGFAPLRNANDYGTFAWADSQRAQEGIFGQGYGDLPGGTTPIKVTLVGKADFYDDIFGPEALLSKKQLQTVFAAVDLINQTQEQQVDFYIQAIVDLNLTLGRVLPDPTDIQQMGGIWDVDNWDVMYWAGGGASTFGIVKGAMQNSARGNIIQIGLMETSVFPWVLLSMVAYANCQKVGR